MRHAGRNHRPACFVMVMTPAQPRTGCPVHGHCYYAKKGRLMLAGQSVSRILVVALALGWSADTLFYRNQPGISVLLFVGLLLAVLFALGRREGVRPVPANLWLL